MKTFLLTSICSAALILTTLAQDPVAPDPAAPPPAPTAPAVQPGATATASAPAVPTAPTAPATPARAATPADDEEEDLERAIERKVRRGLSITFGDDKKEERNDRPSRPSRVSRHNDFDVDDGALMAIPIVGIIFTTLFGAPVLIVGVIMFFSYIKARSLHKTVRLMVEKGQPVPEALFAAPQTPVRQRSDMRRGIILVMVGIGVMILFGALDDWDGGAWALGIIPFLIGATYLLFWKLEGNKLPFDKAGTDNPPPLP